MNVNDLTRYDNVDTGVEPYKNGDYVRVAELPHWRDTKDDPPPIDCLVWLLYADGSKAFGKRLPHRYFRLVVLTEVTQDPEIPPIKWAEILEPLEGEAHS